VPVTMGEEERERERGVCSSVRGGKRVVKYRRARREREKNARCCVRACVAASSARNLAISSSRGCVNVGAAIAV